MGIPIPGKTVFILKLGPDCLEAIRWTQSHRQTQPWLYKVGASLSVNELFAQTSSFKMGNQILYHILTLQNSTLLMWNLEYTGKTRSMSWLLMPWIDVLPGHQMPYYYWPCRTGGLPSSYISATCIEHLSIRAASRLAPSQWETTLQSNAVSHWLGTKLDSALSKNEI